MKKNNEWKDKDIFIAIIKIIYDFLMLKKEIKYKENGLNLASYIDDDFGKFFPCYNINSTRDLLLNILYVFRHNGIEIKTLDAYSDLPNFNKQVEEIVKDMLPYLKLLL